MANPIIKFTIKDFGEITAELYPDKAPKTVENFLKLVDEGFFSGLIFHRVICGFMIQGGGYNEDFQQKHTASIKGEFASNGFEQNTLSHTRGTISMWHASDDPDSATTSFFIMQKDSTACDGKYAAFGRVILGMETIDAIAAIALTEEHPSNTKTKPVKPPVIESVTFIQPDDIVIPQ